MSFAFNWSVMVNDIFDVRTSIPRHVIYIIEDIHHMKGVYLMSQWKSDSINYSKFDSILIAAIFSGNIFGATPIMLW